MCVCIYLNLFTSACAGGAEERHVQVAAGDVQAAGAGAADEGDGGDEARRQGRVRVQARPGEDQLPAARERGEGKPETKTTSLQRDKKVRENHP